jgi:hypothetical protein
VLAAREVLALAIQELPENQVPSVQFQVLVAATEAKT